VIGDWKASMANYEKMANAGVSFIPVYHIGDPESMLVELAQQFPRIGIGGMADQVAGRKLKWGRQVFARVWPKAIHGLGCASDDILLALPFHSADATSWELGPTRWGRWKAFDANLSVRGNKQNLEPEIAYYQKLERRARERWHRTWAELGEIEV
jgi:hypothetical protein